MDGFLKLILNTNLTSKYVLKNSINKIKKGC